MLANGVIPEREYAIFLQERQVCCMVYWQMRANFFTILGVICTVAGMSVSAQEKAAPPAKSAEPAQGIIMPNQEKAKELAETVYNTWRLSVQRGDSSGWASCTTASRRMKVHNLIISERGEFPRDFFRSAQSAPMLENFRYVGALGGCGGKTLAVTYLGKVQLGDAAAKQNAFVLEFVQEEGKWKLDQTRFFDLSKLPGVAKRLQARDLSVLKEQDGFYPYSVVPAVPPSCGKPELIGKVFVDAPGRAIDLRINGVSIHEFDNERRADTISGGLRKGANSISYTIRDSAYSNERPSMAIGVFVMPEAQGYRPVCVFDHVLGEGDAAQGGTFNFTITPEQLASMNPQSKAAAPQPFHAVPLKKKPEPAKK